MFFMQTKHLCVLIHIWAKGEVWAPWNRFKPSSKIFYWPFQGGASFVNHLCYFYHFFCYAFVHALCLPAGKRLTSWLSFVIVKLSVSHRSSGSGVVLGSIDSCSLPSFLICYQDMGIINYFNWLPGYQYYKLLSDYTYLIVYNLL